MSQTSVQPKVIVKLFLAWIKQSDSSTIRIVNRSHSSLKLDNLNRPEKKISQKTQKILNVELKFNPN